MQAVFPDLLFLGPYYAPLILRAGVAIYFLLHARAHWLKKTQKFFRDYWISFRGRYYNLVAQQLLAQNVPEQEEGCHCIKESKDEHYPSCQIGKLRDHRVRELVRYELEERMFELEDEIEDLKQRMQDARDKK